MTCLPEPSVTNAKAGAVTEDNDTVTAFYECQAGFSMAGSPRISCNKTLDVWDAAPSCIVIDDNVYVYNYGDEEHEWWYYFLAAILTLLFLLLLALVIWCCCWAPRSYFYDCRCCCIRQKSRRLQDRNTHNNSSGTRKDVFWIDSNDNKYWSNQALGHYLYSDSSQNGSLTSLITNNRRPPPPQPPHHHHLHPNHHHPSRGSMATRDVGVEARLDSPCSTSRGHTSSSGRCSSMVGTQKSSAAALLGNHLRPGMAERTTDSHPTGHWIDEVYKVDAPDRSVTSKGTAREIQVTRAAKPAKDPTKDTKIWMPHSHSIRDINTSTK